MKCVLSTLLRDDGGATMVEYGLVAAAIALPIILLGVAIATACGTALTTTGTGLTNIGQNPP